MGKYIINRTDLEEKTVGETGYKRLKTDFNGGFC
jgi:hypothetical protein